MLKHDPSIGIISYVHGWYVDYIPTFVYTVNKAYPEYHIKLFIRDELPDYIRPTLDGAEVVENYFSRRGKTNDPAKLPYYLRFLIPYDDLQEFDQVFICDIDLLMLREATPLHEQRNTIMKQIGLPFANYLRDPHHEWPERFTGWHYISVLQYFEKVGPIIDQIPLDFDITDIPSYSYGDGLGSKRFGQEALLYKILTDAFQIDIEALRQSKIAFPTHHGIHLGPMRSNIYQKFCDGDESAINHFGLNAKYWRKELLTTMAKDSMLFEIFYSLPNGHVKTILAKFFSCFGKIDV